MPPAPRIHVRSSRYDGSMRDAFDAELLEERDGVIRVRIYEKARVETARGPIEELPVTTTQILFTDRWYNVLHMQQVVTPYRNLWYCNMAMPARRGDGEISWTDLDLDVMCDFEQGVLLKDVELFEQRAADGYYPPEIVERVRSARDDVLALAASGAFPFDHERQIL